MKTKIMVADDDEAIRNLVAAILGNDERYTVSTARNGEEALEIARVVKPDIILLDIWMAPKTGWEVCESLKRDPETAQTKVVMLSGLIQDSVRRKAMQLGAVGYITKPFSPTDLLNAVEELTEPLKEPEGASSHALSADGTAINDLLTVDRLLATILIDEASSGIALDPEREKKVDQELAQALEDLDKGDAERADGEPDEAIQHYGKAWEHTTKALKELAKSPDDNGEDDDEVENEDEGEE